MNRDKCQTIWSRDSPDSETSATCAVEANPGKPNKAKKNSDSNHPRHVMAFSGFFRVLLGSSGFFRVVPGSSGFPRRAEGTPQNDPLCVPVMIKSMIWQALGNAINALEPDETITGTSVSDSTRSVPLSHLPYEAHDMPDPDTT